MAELPKDLETYFTRESSFPRRFLRFSFDTPEGIMFTSELMRRSIAYLDYEREPGPEERFEEWINDHGFTQELEAANAKDAQGDHSALHDLWLDYFDMEFDLAQDDGYLIVHCVSPDGYEGDRQYYLIAEEEYEAMRIPAEWRHAIA